MSHANRVCFVFHVAILTVCDTILDGFAKHRDELPYSQLEEGEIVWVRRIREQVYNGDDRAFTLDGIKPKALERLKRESSALTDAMIKDKSILVMINTFMAWCGDILDATRDPAKLAFYGELHSNLDGIYAMIDPHYERIDEATEAITETKRLIKAIT